jgi:hypothetical protein
MCVHSFLTATPKAAAERSKTVILAKNLPAGTPAAELQETFGRFGSLGRVLLPEGGVTAIVEFLEPLEARKAFRHLAYSKVGLCESGRADSLGVGPARGSSANPRSAVILHVIPPERPPGLSFPVLT